MPSSSPLLQPGESPRKTLTTNGPICRSLSTFVRAIRRDYVRVSPRPNAGAMLRQLPSWIAHYNEVHPHKALGYRSPRESIATLRKILTVSGLRGLKHQADSSGIFVCAPITRVTWQDHIMATRKRHRSVEIAAKLLEMDALSAKGKTQSRIAKTLGISVMTLYRWRKMRTLSSASSRPVAAGNLDQLESRSALGNFSRIAQLEFENAHLRKLVTDLLLENMQLKGQPKLHRTYGKGKFAN
jgi:Integrase core domain/Homeodomain-like domain